MENLNPQSRVDDTLRCIVFATVILRKKALARTYLAKATGVHVDTISAHNMKLEENGILDICREYHKVNVYSHKYMMVLAGLFGFVDPMKWRNASLTNYIYNNSSMVTKIMLIIEEGKECFSTESREMGTHKLQTEIKSRMWDDLLGGYW